MQNQVHNMEHKISISVASRKLVSASAKAELDANIKAVH